ncbi:MAG: MucR family transcriptional regulator, partial [Chlorobium sp.]|nr:MucR family transcriptional regulator [Chlorobium sp.]
MKRFESKEQVLEYLSGDTVECLVCGKRLKHLGKHLLKHGMSSDDYREEFNIPWTFALSGQATREKQRAACVSRIESGSLQMYKVGQSEKNLHSSPKRRPRDYDIERIVNAGKV